MNRLNRLGKRGLTKTNKGDIPSKGSPKSTNMPQNAPHWSTNAACLGKGDKMFPKGHKDLSYISEARRICRTCPVRKDCLEYALSFPTSDLHGVWAGLTPRQLSAEAQRLGVSPERFTLAQVWAAYNKPK